MTVSELIAELQKMPQDQLIHPEILPPILRARLYLVDDEETQMRECRLLEDGQVWFAYNKTVIDDSRAMESYCRHEHPGFNRAALMAPWGTYLTNRPE